MGYHRYVDAVIDSSTLISLAWAGHLDLLQRSPLRLIVPAEVRKETVAEGLARGHPDAAAIDVAVAPLASMAAPDMRTVDEAVLYLGRSVGMLLANDVALGRRAANLGAGWLRTADYVVLCVRSGEVDATHGLAAIHALFSAGCLTAGLYEAYRKEFA